MGVHASAPVHAPRGSAARALIIRGLTVRDKIMAKLIRSTRSTRSIKRTQYGCVVEVVRGGETTRYTRVKGGWTARISHGEYSPWEDVATVFTSWDVAQQVNTVARDHTREHHAYIF